MSLLVGASVLVAPSTAHASDTHGCPVAGQDEVNICLYSLPNFQGDMIKVNLPCGKSWLSSQGFFQRTSSWARTGSHSNIDQVSAWGRAADGSTTKFLWAFPYSDGRYTENAYVGDAVNDKATMILRACD